LYCYSGPDGPGSYYGSVYARDSEKDETSSEEEPFVAAELSSSPIAFKDQDSESNAHELAYSGYKQFHNR
jgi:hypothetical protein